MTPKGAEAIANVEATQPEKKSSPFMDLFAPPEDVEDRKPFTLFQQELWSFLRFDLVREDPSAKRDLTELRASLSYVLPQEVAATTDNLDKSIRIKRLTPSGNTVIEEAAKGISFASGEGKKLGFVGDEAVKAIQLDIILERGRKTKKGREGRKEEVNTPPPLIRANFYGETKELASLAIRQDPQDGSIRAEFRAGFLKGGQPVRSKKFPNECAEAFSQIQHTLAHRLLSPEEIVEAVEEVTEGGIEKEEVTESGERLKWIEGLKACEAGLKALIYPEAIPPNLIDTLRKKLPVGEGALNNERALLCYLLDVAPEKLEQPDWVIDHLGEGAPLVPNLSNIVETTLVRRMEKEGKTTIQSIIAQNVLRDIREQFQMLKTLGEEEVV